MGHEFKVSLIRMGIYFPAIFSCIGAGIKEAKMIYQGDWVSQVRWNGSPGEKRSISRRWGTIKVDKVNWYPNMTEKGMRTGYLIE